MISLQERQYLCVAPYCTSLPYHLITSNHYTLIHKFQIKFLHNPYFSINTSSIKTLAKYVFWIQLYSDVTESIMIVITWFSEPVVMLVKLYEVLSWKDSGHHSRISLSNRRTKAYSHPDLHKLENIYSLFVNYQFIKLHIFGPYHEPTHL